MRMLRSRAAASIAALAALSLTATPVLAHGYGGWGRHYHRHGDGGDVLAAVLIVGGLAAIANAASTSVKDDQPDEPYRYPGGPDYSKPDDQDYSEAPDQDRDEAARDYGADAADNATSGGFDDAVKRCADEMERGERRIGSVDDVSRSDEDYTVSGRLEDGRRFTCSVDRSGQVGSVAVDGDALI